MNRYQFEDLISEYIENELSLSKRKEFEAYLEENPDEMKLVESVRSNMSQMKVIPKVKASSDFNDRLFNRIQTNRAQLDRPIPSQRTYFGFSPIHASLMTGLVIATVFVSMQLFSPEDGGLPLQTQNFANESLPTLSNPSLQKVNHPQPDFVKVDEDSVMEDQKSKPNQDFSKKMHFVNEND
jgi:anti-sigma-K factor RskA